MAITPSVWTPVVTAYVNPDNIAPDEHGYFNDFYVLERTKQSLLLQGSVSLALFLVGVTLIFPAPTVSELDKEQGPINELPNYVSKKEILHSTNASLRNEDGLTPTQAIKTKVFFLLSLKIMLTEMVFFYLLFVYK
ncbi:Major Facilitator-like protein 5, partial [Leptotrombidium deliense]